MGGVAGIANKYSTDSVFYCIECLHSLQHRGHGGSCLISTDIDPDTDKGYMLFPVVEADGLVYGGLSKKLTAAGNDEAEKTGLSIGNVSNKHITYPTRHSAKSKHGRTGIVFSGYPDMENIPGELKDKGSVMEDSNNPAEVLNILMATKSREMETDDIFDSLAASLESIKGRYACLVITEDGIFAARDPYGMEPLSLYTSDDAVVFASESCAFPLNAEFEDVKPGEIVFVNMEGVIERREIFREEKEKRCLHELVWNANPCSTVYGEPVSVFRENLGRRLAELYGDLFPGCFVVPVPDSGLYIGDGFSKYSSHPVSHAVLRSHNIRYLDETPGPEEKLKINPHAIKDKMVIIEDSVNRGTTARKIAQMLRDAGAKEVYLLSATPPRLPCRYRPEPREPLLAERVRSREELKRELGVNRFHFLEIKDIFSLLKEPEKYCTECFNSNPKNHCS